MRAKRRCHGPLPTNVGGGVHGEGVTEAGIRIRSSPGGSDTDHRAVMLTIVALLFGFAGAAMGAATFGDPDVADYYNSVPNSTNNDTVSQMINLECRNGYTAFCLKLNLIRLVSRGSGMKLSLMPGVSITSSAIPDLPDNYDQKNFLQDPDQVDGLLLEKLSEYIGSLSLTIKIIDKNTPQSFAKNYLDDSTATARKRNRFGGALAAAGLMSGGTLLAAGMAALAAMAGKALMASLLALMLSALSALKGQGGGGEKTTYEVIAKPVVSHLHTHSSEVQHAGHHSHYRSIDAHDAAYAAHAPQAIDHDDYLPIDEGRH